MSLVTYFFNGFHVFDSRLQQLFSHLRRLSYRHPSYYVWKKEIIRNNNNKIFSKDLRFLNVTFIVIQPSEVTRTFHYAYRRIFIKKVWLIKVLSKLGTVFWRILEMILIKAIYPYEIFTLTKKSLWNSTREINFI